MYNYNQEEEIPVNEELIDDAPAGINMLLTGILTGFGIAIGFGIFRLLASKKR